jgi:hypothetical protein
VRRPCGFRTVLKPSSIVTHNLCGAPHDMIISRPEIPRQALRIGRSPHDCGKLETCWASDCSIISFSVTSASIVLQIRAGRCEALAKIFSPLVEGPFTEVCQPHIRSWAAPLAGERDSLWVRVGVSQDRSNRLWMYPFRFCVTVSFSIQNHRIVRRLCVSK